MINLSSSILVCKGTCKQSRINFFICACEYSIIILFFYEKIIGARRLRVEESKDTI